jgi:hypothetical protein
MESSFCIPGGSWRPLTQAGRVKVKVPVLLGLEEGRTWAKPFSFRPSLHILFQENWRDEEFQIQTVTCG